MLDMLHLCLMSAQHCRRDYRCRRGSHCCHGFHRRCGFRCRRDFRCRRRHGLHCCRGCRCYCRRRGCRCCRRCRGFRRRRRGCRCYCRRRGCRCCRRRRNFVIAMVSSWLCSLAESICIQGANLSEWVPGSICVHIPPHASAHTMELCDAIGRATNTNTARSRCLQDMCSLPRKSCTIYLVGMQVIGNMKKLTPENQKEVDL